jgi:hypothetical protein
VGWWRRHRSRGSPQRCPSSGGSQHRRPGQQIWPPRPASRRPVQAAPSGSQIRAQRTVLARPWQSPAAAVPDARP